MNHNQEPDFYPALSPEQKEEIELGMEEIERGETVSLEEILADFKSQSQL